MRNAAGQVIVNPNYALGLDDFAQLYSEQATPDESASFIHMHYPMEAKSYMDKQWSQLGINQPPESYFNDVLRKRKAQPVLQPLQNGTTTPSARSAILPPSDSSREAYDQNARIGTSLRTVPLPTSDLKGGELLNSQLAGDAGDVKRFLLKQQGIDYENYLNTPAAQRPEIKPYVSNVGTGRLDETDLPSRLDSNIYSNPDFRRLLNTNPERAAYMYSRLTGRDYTTDYTETDKLRKSQIDMGREFTSSQLKQGAKYDPTKGTWQVWNATEQSDPMGLRGSQTVRQLIDATPEQNQWMNTHYSSIMNQPLPVVRSPNTGMEVNPHAGWAGVQSNLQQLQNNPDLKPVLDSVAQEVERVRQKVGYITPLTHQKIIDDALNKHAVESNRPGWWDRHQNDLDEGIRRGIGLDPAKAQGSIMSDLATQDYQDAVHANRINNADQAYREGRITAQQYEDRTSGFFPVMKGFAGRKADPYAIENDPQTMEGMDEPNSIMHQQLVERKKALEDRFVQLHNSTGNEGDIFGETKAATLRRLRDSIVQINHILQ